MTESAVTLAARILGSLTSKKKKVSSRANGKKGGRPKGSKNSVDRKPSAR